MEHFAAYHDDHFNDSATDAYVAFNEFSNTRTTVYTVYHILIWLQLLHVPLIATTNTLVILTVRLVTRLHTPDNYIIAGLAFTDLFQAFFTVPFMLIWTLQSTKPFFHQSFARCVIRFAIPNTLMDTSIAILMLLTMDRCLSITRPFWYIENVSRKCVVWVMLIMLVAEAFRCSVIWGATLKYEETGEITKRCRYLNSELWYTQYLEFVKLCIEIGIAFICTAVVAFISMKQLRITYELTKRMGIVRLHEAKKQVRQVQTTIMLMFVFLLLWSPTLVTPLLSKTNMTREEHMLVHMVTYHLRMLNCSANAIIYGLSKKVYKNSYIFFLTHRPTKWKHLNVLMREAYYITHSQQPDVRHENYSTTSTQRTTQRTSQRTTRTTPKVSTCDGSAENARSRSRITENSQARSRSGNLKGGLSKREQDVHNSPF